MKHTMWRRNLLWMICLGVFATGAGIIHAQPVPFSVGEMLEFKFSAFGVTAGEQTMRLDEKTVYEGRSAYKITISADAKLGSIYKYKETGTLLLDEKGCYPLFVHRNIEEKDGSYWIEITYNPGTKQLIRKSTKSGKETTDTYTVENGCMEDLSLFYYLRTHPWAKGDKDFFFLKKQGPERFLLTVKDGEEIKTSFGKYKTDLIENPDSGYTLWFSKDEKALPLMFKKGKITCKLVKISNS